MKHTIVIDDSTAIGKHLLGLIKTMGPNVKGVILDEEANEDAAIGRMIAKGLESGLADKKRVLQKLKIK